MAENLEPNEQLKWEFLREVPLRDATSTETRGNDELREIAAHLARVANFSPWPQFVFAQLAHCLARDCIQYQTDTDRLGREQIDGWPPDPYISPIAPYTRGFDDCDAKARIFVALCLCRAMHAEMVPRQTGTKLSHVYARVFVRGPDDGMPRWYYVETILRRARPGEVAEHVPREIDTRKWLF
jgi:hypothetical protein